MLLLPLAAILPAIVSADSEPGNGFPSVGAVVFEDNGARARPAKLWGSIDCARPGRVRHIRVGNAGAGLPRNGYRRLRVVDGDDFWGERCELGRNDHRVSPVALYREGQRRITFVSFRLRRKFPIRRRVWQSVMQMKQSQPSDSGSGEPMLSLQVYDGRWRLKQRPGGDVSRERTVWSARAVRTRWIRFAFDVVYSKDPHAGSIQVFSDLNGDGDALDPRERSHRVRGQTLKVEGPGDDRDGVPPGAAIPSHLRVGVYHSPSYRCRKMRCALDVDNVRVYESP